MNTNRTIQYYDEKAEEFSSHTRDVDFQITQDRFLSRLQPGSRILDFGCGSGRDTKYFLSRGYEVTATDGSAELCRLASYYTGIKVKRLLFEELDENEEYDGIWACSSILHLPYIHLVSVLQKAVLALKKEGILYSSFKYGTFEGERNGRFFTDMTETKIQTLLREMPNFLLLDQWITTDVRPGREEEKWLNVILQKKEGA